MAQYLKRLLFCLVLVAARFAHAEPIHPKTMVGAKCDKATFTKFIDWAFQDETDQKLKNERLQDGLGAIQVFEKYHWQTFGSKLTETERRSVGSNLKPMLPETLGLLLKEKQTKDFNEENSLPVFGFGLHDAGITCFDGVVVSVGKYDNVDKANNYLKILQEKYGTPTHDEMPAPKTHSLSGAYNRKLEVSNFQANLPSVALVRDVCSFVEAGNSPYVETTLYYFDRKLVLTAIAKINARNGELQKQREDRNRKSKEQDERKLRDSL